MTDGNIVAARTRLGRAVQKLTAPRCGVYYDVTFYAPSLYDCLAADVGGCQQGDSRTPAKSLPPIWIDAMQLMFEMSAKTRSWCSKPGTTPERLQHIAFQTWRPQDTSLVNDIARTVEEWAQKILHLLDPENTKSIDAPCPSCGRKTVYRKDSAGETVRQPALKLIANVGCTCQACDAHWPPEKFLFLQKLLGFAPTEGVVG